ncbi:MAG: RNA polymerase sigma factor [Ferruginibacter sp.]
MNLSTFIPPADVLVQQCIDGDMAACRVLYNRYSKAMFNTALRILNHTADAEDVLQESFSDAFAKLKDFQGRSTFGAWLKQIVVNKSITVLKKQRLFLADMEINVMENIADEPQLNEEEINYTIDAVKRNIQQLPDGYRTVLLLYLFEGYDHEEIAEILQVAQSTVRTQYIRARQKLVHLLKKETLYEQ